MGLSRRFGAEPCSVMSLSWSLDRLPPGPLPPTPPSPRSGSTAARASSSNSSKSTVWIDCRPGLFLQLLQVHCIRLDLWYERGICIGETGASCYNFLLKVTFSQKHMQARYFCLTLPCNITSLLSQVRHEPSTVTTSPTYGASCYSMQVNLLQRNVWLLFVFCLSKSLNKLTS